jgi:hypothetical protein
LPSSPHTVSRICKGSKRMSLCQRSGQGVWSALRNSTACTLGSQLR